MSKRILNFGSLNIDHVYSVDHFVRPGETLGSSGYQVFPGGKGANQSTALALAGAQVSHAGKLGTDGAWYRERLAGCGVNVEFTEVVEGPSGHAVIQVSRSGENAIILFGGANQQVCEVDAQRVVGSFAKGGFLLLQNEISAIPAIMRAAAARGLRIVFNPAPMNSAVLAYPLQLVDTFVVNEIEGSELSGADSPDAVLDSMAARYPEAATVLTLGSRGAAYARGETRLRCGGYRVEAVDTTAAGDTFIGYYLAELALERSVEQALDTGCRAAALSVTRMGAASSIPRREEVDSWNGKG